MSNAPNIPISQRVMGSVLICAALFIVDPTRTGVPYQLGAPLCLALGTYLVTRAHVAIAGTIAILALLGSDLQATDPVVAIIYPVIGVLCAALTTGCNRGPQIEYAEPGTFIDAERITGIRHWW